jgi:hypothetical protein
MEVFTMDNKNSLILESLAGNRKELSSLSAFVRYLEEHMKKEFSSCSYGVSGGLITTYGKSLMGDKLFHIDFNRNNYEVYFNPFRMSVIVDTRKHSSSDFGPNITDDMKKLFFRTVKLDAVDYLPSRYLKDILVFKINFNTGKAYLYYLRALSKVIKKYDDVYNLSSYYKEFAKMLWGRSLSLIFYDILYGYSYRLSRELIGQGFKRTYSNKIVYVK